MTDLTTRLAQADKPTRELLEEVFGACFPEPPLHQWGDVMDRVLSHDRFTAMLDAEAWTSAVEMLVPADVEWNCENWTSNGVYPEHVRATAWAQGSPRTYAATPALALAIACLKARGL